MLSGDMHEMLHIIQFDKLVVPAVLIHFCEIYKKKIHKAYREYEKKIKLKPK